MIIVLKPHTTEENITRVETSLNTEVLILTLYAVQR